MSSKTCGMCTCWRKTGTGHAPRRIVHDNGATIVPPGEEGECHLSGPISDFRWPLTSAAQGCAQHRTTTTGIADAVDALAKLEAELIAERHGDYRQDTRGDGLFTAGTGDAAPEATRNGGLVAAVDAKAPQSTAPQTETPAPALPARAAEATGNRPVAGRSSQRGKSR